MRKKQAQSEEKNDNKSISGNWKNGKYDIFG